MLCCISPPTLKAVGSHRAGGSKVPTTTARPLRAPGRRALLPRAAQDDDRNPTGLADDIRSTVFGTGLAIAMGLGSLAPYIPLAAAASNADVGPCVVRSCGLALAGCLADPTCVENLVCLQACEGSPDKAGCQVKCGDLYSDNAVQRFDTCALSEKKCVPQIQDDGSYPKPPDCAVVEKFDTSKFQGRWFINAGLNPLFDTFDCQAHYFTEGKPGTIYGAINWRVKKPNGFFYQRNAQQQLVQDPEVEGHLVDTGGEFLHFSDDWYVLGSKFEGGPDDYVLVFYRGNNDAWLGYGGGFLYTKQPSLPQEIIPEVKERLENAGLDWEKWTITDNTCGPEPKVLEEEIFEAEESISSFGKKAVTAVENEAELELIELEVDVEEELGMLRKAIENEFKVLQNIEQEFVSNVESLTSQSKRAERAAAREKAKAEKKLEKMMTKNPVAGMDN